jgi:REP element-mobilizing transposase RayT
MEKINKFPKRKPNRLKKFDYSQNGAYFVTICTKDKEKLLWNKNFYDTSVGADNIRPQVKVPLSEYGKIADTAIKNISTHYTHINVENYIIMPNHIHILLFIDRFDDGRIISAPTLSVVIGQLKRWISRQIGKSVFQKSFHDHIIRNDEDYKKIYNYIESNPSLWTEDCFYIE